MFIFHFEPAFTIPDVYENYEEAFYGDNKLPKHSVNDCKITFKESVNFQPTNLTPLTSEEEEALKNHLSEFLNKGFIRKSKSPITHPVKFRKKNDGSLLVCVDFNKVKKKLNKYSYPIPKISDIYESIKGATIFTKLNLKSAFTAIRVAQGDEFKTAIKTKFGCFEYLVMPQGLPDGPSFFQSFIEDIFSNELNNFVKVYMDDILIYSKNQSQHIQHVKAVLNILIKHHLVANIDKCEFHQSEINYLGNVLCKDGIKIDPEKIEKVSSWPQPTTITELKSFIGYCNFLRKFVPNFASTLKPLYDLSKDKSANKSWTNECQDSFLKIKNQIASATTLSYPNPEKSYYVKLSSNSNTIAAALCQLNDNETVLKVVYYYSRILQGSEMNYIPVDKELLALKQAFQEWQYLLFKSRYKIHVCTKNEFLSSIIQTPVSNTQSLLCDYIENFNFQIDDDQLNNNFCAMKYDENAHVKITLSDIKNCYKTDDYAKKVIFDLNFNTNTSGYAFNWILKNGVLLRKYNKNQTYIPSQLRRIILKRNYDLCYDGDLSCNKFYQILNEDVWWPGLKQDIKAYYAERDHKRLVQSYVEDIPELEDENEKIPPWKFVYFEFLFDRVIRSGNSLISDDACIMIIRDEGTKMVHFIGFNHRPNPQMTSEGFLSNVVKSHGCPSLIVSETRVRSDEWSNILDLCHSQHYICDTSRMKNDKEKIFVRNYLKLVMEKYNYSNWKSFLSLAEACFNHFIHPSINKTPMEAYRQYQCYDEGRGSQHGKDPFENFLPLINDSNCWKKFNRMLEQCKEEVFG